MEFRPKEIPGLVTVTAEAGYKIWAKHYDSMVVNAVDHPILKQMIQHFEREREHLVLDIGCGTGRNLQFLMDQGLSVKATGVDISSEMINIAESKRLYHDIHIGKFPVLERRHEIAISVLMSCHLDSLEELYKYAADNLVNEGELVVVDMHPHIFYSGIGTFLPAGSGRVVHIKNYVHHLSDHSRIAQDLGFELRQYAESFVPESFVRNSKFYADFVGKPFGFGMRFVKSDFG